MDPRLLVVAALGAALTLTAAPAQAQHRAGDGIPEAKTSHFIGSTNSPDLGTCDQHRDGRDGRHDHVSHCDGWAYADGSWALYNNRSWEPDSYNDWWHDRPDRAYPRWVQEQRMRGTCTPDRMWWSGSGWHC
jgi:hypothetical protein